MSGKYSHKLLGQTKQSARDALKSFSKRVIYSKNFKKSDFIGNKTPKRVKKKESWKGSPQDNSETITNEHDEEIPKERYISLEERPKIIDYLRLIYSSANIKPQKAEFHKIEQSGGFLDRLLGPLLKTRFSLIKNVPNPLGKSV